MKRILAMVICLCMVTSFAACSRTKTEEEVQAEKKQSVADLTQAVNAQNLIAVDKRVFTDENGIKWLLADIENKMTDEIKISQMVIAFLAWDADGIPVQIKTKNNPDSTYYLYEATVSHDVIIPKGETWTADAGLQLAKECDEVSYVEAIAVSGIISGEEWKNPCYDTWYEIYHGQLLTDWQRETMTSYRSDDEIDSSDGADSTVDDVTDKPDSLTFSEFYASLFLQEVVGIDAGAHLQEDGRNMLMTDVKNNVLSDATEIRVAFAMWDENGAPLLIESTTGESYVKEVGYGDLMVEGRETWTANMGLFTANERSAISHVEAIVISCKLNGSDWTNPMYEMWKEFFEGQTLTKEMMDIINSFA